MKIRDSRFMLLLLLNASQYESTGHASCGVRQGLTGRGGAPKFLKNWLTFAHSPYDPDHILGPSGGPRGSWGSSLMARPFPRHTQKLGDN